MITFNFETEQFENLPAIRIERWKEACPAVDIELGIKQAALWVVANPKKRKKNWSRFLTNWLMRQQEKGGNLKSNYRQRLLPIVGKRCSSCQMPAVYKSCPGSYDIYHCKNHLPDKVKKEYC